MRLAITAAHAGPAQALNPWGCARARGEGDCGPCRSLGGCGRAPLRGCAHGRGPHGRATGCGGGGWARGGAAGWDGKERGYRCGSGFAVHKERGKKADECSVVKTEGRGKQPLALHLNKCVNNRTCGRHHHPCSHHHHHHRPGSCGSRGRCGRARRTHSTCC